MNYRIFTLSIIIFSFLFLSCKDNSTSTNIENPTNTKPQITTIVAYSKIFDYIKINGLNFGSNIDTSYVLFNSAKGLDFISWNDTLIIVKIPDGTQSCKVSINVKGVKSNEVNLNIPHIISINKTSIKIGDKINLTGTGFGNSRGSNFVSFSGVKGINYSVWNDSLIDVIFPTGSQVSPLKLFVSIDAIRSNQISYSIISLDTVPRNFMPYNLDVDHYRNGDLIPEVKDSAEWANLTTGAWCYANYDPKYTSYYTKFGKLYNWYAVNDPRGLAPVGWHVMSDGEWITLAKYYGGTCCCAHALGNVGEWQPSGPPPVPQPNATNESGFSARPGPIHSLSIHDWGWGSWTVWWTSDEKNSTSAFVRKLECRVPSIQGVPDHDQLSSFSTPKTDGLYVRCIKDK